MSGTVTGLDLTRRPIPELTPEQITDRIWAIEGSASHETMVRVVREQTTAVSDLLAAYDSLADAVPSLLAAARANARIEAMVAVWEADEREYLMRFGQHMPCSLATLSESVRAALGTEQEGRTE